ncbi:MAG: hypothetical protein ACRDK2_00310, partial [Solirubrobacteraceae bacterium]
MQGAARDIHAEREERARELEPEHALLAQEDEFLVGEFIAELTEEERLVFALVGEEESWRAIASVLSIPPNEARKLTRSCERKRARFVTLFESGRLCGARSHTIGALLAGEQSTETAVRQAVAHLRYCRDCQARHRTSGRELRARFDTRALALLPAPTAVCGHVGLTDRILVLAHRGLRDLDRLIPGGGTVRERATEGLAGGAGLAKAAVVVGVIAVGGVAVEAHHVSGGSHHGTHSSQQSASSGTQVTHGLVPGGSDPFGWPVIASHETSPSTPGRLVRGNIAPGALVGPASPGALVHSSSTPGRLVTGGASANRDPRGPGTLVASSGHSGSVRGPEEQTASSASSQPSPA